MGLRVTVDSPGCLLTRVEVRKQFGFKEGDSVPVEPVGPGEFKVVLLKNAVEWARGMYHHLRYATENVSDELVAERRRESEGEADHRE